ncbi:VOC family protein [Specibacter sp. AOP5-B1-6]|uniref:VOC family protein n=1 Tax=Specibacter sp. AOP5-B1-6 TaxID=3457653 RepID=UPI003FB6C03F
MAGIGTCLWFDGQAEEAANFYVGLFPNSRIGEVLRWGGDGPGVPGSVLTISFELDGRSFRGLNGGPEFTFSEAISFELFFDTQAELDEKWNALTSDGGQESQCGWLKDKFGVSWQLVPTMMTGVLNGPDPDGAARAMQAMMGMKKLVIAELQAAYDG